MWCTIGTFASISCLPSGSSAGLKKKPAVFFAPMLDKTPMIWQTMNMNDNNVILSYGMGVESTAILLRWIMEPATRPCALDNLTVITAQVGDEYPDTGRDVDTHIVPLMRQHGIRWVQVARAGHSQTDGITILEDSTRPSRTYLDGDYKLSDELRRSGTVPTYSGVHKCALKFKAWVIETWLNTHHAVSARHAFGYNSDETKRAGKSEHAIDTRMAFGFNAEETKRADRGNEYNTVTRTGFYPLIEWGWTRQDCIDYIERILGVVWRKSACVFCPFNTMCGDAAGRHMEHPEAVAKALMLEQTSMALNPRGTLYKNKSLISITVAAGNTPALDAFAVEQSALPWTVYRVRRIYTGPGRADRAVEPTGRYTTETEAIAALTDRAAGMNAPIVKHHGMSYVYEWQKRTDGVYPTIEEFYVAAPATMEAKSRYGIPKFDARWYRLAA